MDSKDCIFSKIRDEKMDNIGPILNKKIIEMK